MAGSGHIGGSLSSMDILTVLYYKYMNIKKDDPTWADRDRFILSKGHIGIGYAGLLCDLGWNDPEQLKTFNLTNSKMGVHLDSNKVVGVTLPQAPWPWPFYRSRHGSGRPRSEKILHHLLPAGRRRVRRRL